MFVHGSEPWQMRPGDFVPESAHHQAYTAHYFDAAGHKVASSRMTPAVMVYPEGCWLYNDTCPGIYGHELEQYRWLDPARISPQESAVFTNEEGRADDAERYASWLRQGLVPPPIGVVEAHNGDWRITNGHRRWRAAQLAGMKVPAWFGPRQLGRDGRYLITGLTYEVALLNACLASLEPPAGELDRVVREVQAGRYGMELPRQYPEFFKQEALCRLT
jgi:hypothetical protein